MISFFVSKKKGLSFYFELPNLYYKCLQALCNLSVLPFVESRSDRFSLSFRPYRYCSDIFLCLKHILNFSDLSFFSHCNFDLLNFPTKQAWLFKNFPFDKTIFNKLLGNIKTLFSLNDIKSDGFYINQFSISNTVRNFLFDGLVRIFKPKFYLTLTLIRNHKSRLKNIVKNSFDLNTYNMVSKLNYYISRWIADSNFTDCFWDVWCEMDMYTNKLLWKWARRRHSRRPNIWIYNKYWKPFLSNWKFFSVDSITGNIAFLKSHYSVKPFIYRLPISLDVFDLRNDKKVRELNFKRYKTVLKGLYFLLWHKQHGLCFTCNRPFFLFRFGCFKVCKKAYKNTNFISSMVLLHKYCYF
uniref:putative group II intron reverse transcriptase/maturase RoaA n=1 Tax=Strombomonas costata TaxID=161230 RepID=UPI0023AADD5B|nr:putative group II intron reverse transcriptase/maturase RoaA [Strombomonas costata]WCH63601.1 putative group II intron reverse transcriptase/maturase RoaA [Strombomonas costata]